MTGVCCVMLSSLYRCPNISIEGYCVYTNTPTAGAHRGYGNPQAMFALESQIDMIAEKLKIDPMEFRLKNHIQVGDIGPMGLPVPSCGLDDCIKKGERENKVGGKTKKNWSDCR